MSRGNCTQMLVMFGANWGAWRHSRVARLYRLYCDRIWHNEQARLYSGANLKCIYCIGQVVDSNRYRCTPHELESRDLFVIRSLPV